AVVAATSDYDAVQVDNTPAGNIAATDVQGAINELDSEKQALLVNSAGLAAALSDETGTGLSVYNSSPTLAGTSSLNEALFPQTVSPAVSLRMNDTDSGIGSDGDGAVFISANGFERLRVEQNDTTITGPLDVTGNITAANYPPNGTANTMAIFDTSGDLAA